MNGAERHIAFARIYMDGFEEAKSLVIQAYHNLDLSTIERVVEDDAISQEASKSRAKDKDGAEKDDA